MFHNKLRVSIIISNILFAIITQISCLPCFIHILYDEYSEDYNSEENIIEGNIILRNIQWEIMNS